MSPTLQDHPGSVNGEWHHTNMGYKNHGHSYRVHSMTRVLVPLHLTLCMITLSYLVLRVTYSVISIILQNCFSSCNVKCKSVVWGENAGE